ncbi:MAG TPA: hypothetical protein VEL51_20210 [Vicinamibacterales bacterium]|nr:hypothetical protein [Vicinamibacterales bacterium]
MPTTEKEARTAAERKIDSQLLYEIYRKRGEAAAKYVPSGPTGVRIDAHGRALVDIRGPVTPALTTLVTQLGGSVVSTAPRYQSIIARVPLLKIERIARRGEVRAISPAAEADIRRGPRPSE